MWDLLKDIGKDALKEALRGAGLPEPTIDYQETDETLRLVIAGTTVDGSGTVEDDFQGRIWSGKLRITSHNPLAGHASLSAVLTLRHHVHMDLPHPGDEAEGNLEEVASLSINAAGDTGNRTNARRAIVDHPAAHADIYVVTLSGEAEDNSLGNDLTSWKLVADAMHSNLPKKFLRDPESDIPSVSLRSVPSTSGAAALALAVSGPVRGLAGLSIRLRHPPGVVFPQESSSAEAPRGVKSSRTSLSPTSTEVVLSFHPPVSEPGTLALFDVERPRPGAGARGRFSITRISARDTEGVALPVTGRS